MVERIGRGALAFGVLGLVWAAELGLLLRVGCFDHDDGLALFSLPVLVPCVTATVGAAVAAVAAQPPRLDRSLALALLVPASALLAGIVGGLVWWPDAIGDATATGFALGVGALPLVWPLFRAMRGAARRHSMTEVAQNYSVWAIVGAVGAVSSILMLARWKSYPSCADDPAQATLAIYGSVCIATFAAIALVVHARRARRALALPPAFLDVGVGHDRTEIWTHPPTAYRHTSKTLSVVYGDVQLAQRILRARMRVGMVAAVTAIVAGSTSLILQAR